VMSSTNLQRCKTAAAAAARCQMNLAGLLPLQYTAVHVPMVAGAAAMSHRQQESCSKTGGAAIAATNNCQAPTPC
jgi:hypothetical protein